MLADLDLLLIAFFCTADDLLPTRAKNARRRITDAEVVTLCVAQALLGVASDRRFWRWPRHGCRISSRSCPSSPATSSAASDWATSSRP